MTRLNANCAGHSGAGVDLRDGTTRPRSAHIAARERIELSRGGDSLEPWQTAANDLQRANQHRAEEEGEEPFGVLGQPIKAPYRSGNDADPYNDEGVEPKRAHLSNPPNHHPPTPPANIDRAME